MITSWASFYIRLYLQELSSKDNSRARDNRTFTAPEIFTFPFGEDRASGCFQPFFLAIFDQGQSLMMLHN